MAKREVPFSQWRNMIIRILSMMKRSVLIRCSQLVGIFVPFLFTNDFLLLKRPLFTYVEVSVEFRTI